HLLAWIDLLSMPLGGELGEVLTGDDFAYLDNQPYEPWYASAINFAIPKAYAKNTKKSRLPLGRAVELLKELKAIKKEMDLDVGFIGNLVKQVCALMKDKKAFNKSARLRDVRKILFKPQLWRAMIFLKARVGIEYVINFLKGHNDQRINIFKLVGILALLQKEISDGVISESAADSLKAIMLNAFQFTNTKNMYGAQFQLGVIASYVASNFELVGAELDRHITVHMKNHEPELKRRIDIIVMSKDEEHWIEVKTLLKKSFVESLSEKRNSWRYNPYTDLSKFKISDLGNGSGNYQKEFFLDRSYAGLENISNKVVWCFQKFTWVSKDKKTTKEGVNNEEWMKKQLTTKSHEWFIYKKPDLSFLDVEKQFSIDCQSDSYSKKCWNKYINKAEKSINGRDWSNLFHSVKDIDIPPGTIGLNLKKIEGFIPESD
ncbi:hypothetical protein, partial [Zooshikella harenae]